MYIGYTGYICILIILDLGVKRLAMAENTLEIGIDGPGELELAELELEEDRELELRLEDSVDSDFSESKLPKEKENEIAN